MSKGHVFHAYNKITPYSLLENCFLNKLK